MSTEEILERLREIENLDDDVILAAVSQLIREIEREQLLAAGTRK